jgi:flagellar biosynthesis/type III secretory pathway ATPase
MDLKRTSKKLVATVALAGAVTAGTAGVALAAPDEGAGTPSAEAARHPRRARHLAGVVADTLDVSRADLRSAVKGGMSISEYAGSLGQDPQVVVDALVRAANARIDGAVANGRITAERGEAAKAKVGERVERLVNRHFGQAQGS